MDYPTIEEIKERWPEWGEYPRDELYPWPVEHGTTQIDGVKEALLSLNYSFVGPHLKGPVGNEWRKETMRRQGYCLTVWALSKSFPVRSASRVITKPEELTMELVNELRAEAEAKCTHPEHPDSMIIFDTPTGWHRRYCGACQKEWEWDSSG